MSIMEPPPLEEFELGHDPALQDLRAEVRRQGQEIRTAQRAFSLFAVVALVLSLGTLLAVGIKLDRKATVVVPRAPAPVAATPAKTATAAAPLPHNVDVTLAQFAVSPVVSQAAAGKVTFRVHNAGTIVHEFVVLKTDTAAADIPVVKGRASEKDNIGETGDIKAGETKGVSLKLAAGHYALICNLPGHYLAGQHTDFTVK
jgi:uncharacterized cupredoxin-like copper-binding protein